MKEEIKELRSCSGCGSVPVVSEYFRGGLKIECPGCGRSITEADESYTAFEFWSLINMDYSELAHFAVTELKNQSDRWLEQVRANLGIKIEKQNN